MTKDSLPAPEATAAPEAAEAPEARDASGHLVRELHGVTLKEIVTFLVESMGYERLGGVLPFQCFLSKPTIKSSLIFLRRTPWARAQVEALYIEIKSR